MNKITRNICTVLGTIILVALAILVVIKLARDFIAEKSKDIDYINVINEQEYICLNGTKNIENIKDEIEKDIGKKVEISDTGSLDAIDIYFVVKDGNTYKYITKIKENENEKFEIAQDTENDARYIVPINKIGIDVFVYTELKDYSIDKDGNITYTKM